MKGVLVIAALVAVSAGAIPNGCPKALSTTLLPDFKDCAGFWKCADGVPLFQSCPEGLQFSARLQRCTLPVFARCQAVAGDAPTHASLGSILDTLRNVISRKAQPVPMVEDELSAPPEPPSGDLPDEEDTIRRFPDAEAEAPELLDETDAADGDTEEGEKSKEVGSQKEEQKSADVEVEGELGTMEEMEEEVGKEEEQDESERSEEKIEEDEDEADSDKEETEEKDNEKSEVEDVAENDGENPQDSKTDVTVVKKKDEEEEDENKNKSKDVKSIEKESKKNKSEEKEKDSESEAESEDEE